MSATAADDGDLGGMRMEEEGEDEDEVEEEEDSADPEPFYDESEIFFERIGFNQMFGPQIGGCPLQHTQFNQETCASSQMPTLPSEVVPRVQVGQELGQQMDFKQQGAGREKILPRFPGDSLKRVQVAALYWRTILLLILLSSSC